MAYVTAQYEIWLHEMLGCYERADIDRAWYIKYQVTVTLQQLMNIQKTRKVLLMIRNLLKLESEISIFIYLIINKEILDYPLDYSTQRR